jgi:predicted HicB family RNase H-like nuclease
MKRIVNGVTYNTETSTPIGRSEYDGDNGPVVETLYQTRGGAFFLHEEETRRMWNQRERTHEEKVSHTFMPTSSDDAHKWLMEGDVEVFSNPFEDPPEATAEAEAGSTIYVRVPASLKRRVEEAAKGEGVSGNVWSMRCVERCLDERSRADLAFAWHILDMVETQAMGDEPSLSLNDVSELASLAKSNVMQSYRRLGFALDGADLSAIAGAMEPYLDREAWSRLMAKYPAIR